MDLFRELLWGAALPFAVASVVWLAVLLKWRKAAPGARRVWPRGGSVAIALGFFAGVAGLLGSFPTVTKMAGTESIPYLVMACGFYPYLPWTAAWPVARPLRWVLCAAALACLFQPMISRETAAGLWSGPGLAVLAAAGASTAGIAIVWDLSERAAERCPHTDGVALWLVTLAGESVALLQTGNAMMAQYAGALAASLAPALLLALAMRAPVLGGGTLAAVALPAGMLALVGRFYGELGDAPLALLAAAPIVGNAIALAAVSRPSRGLRAAALLAPLLLVAAAAWLTYDGASPLE